MSDTDKPTRVSDTGSVTTMTDTNSENLDSSTDHAVTDCQMEQHTTFTMDTTLEDM